MKFAHAAAATALAAGLVLTLGACASGTAEDAATSSPDAVETETAGPEETESEGTGSGDAAKNGGVTDDIGTSCEDVNTLMADLRAVDNADHNGYEEIYFRAEEAQETAPVETYDLYSALSLLALERSSGESASQDTSDRMRDALFASAGPCTAEDVTLTF
ncbi:hypothetical protein [Mycetocola sp.]|uniref:hypothetical protein n=1 Tax=Mycetocola sp. TaxID=1871042 RepID=UPI0039894208